MRKHFGKHAYLTKFSFTPFFITNFNQREVPLAVPQGYGRILRNMNACASARNFDGNRKYVKLSTCPGHTDWSFDWAFVKHTTYGRRKPWGFLYNKRFKYCLEHGKNKTPGSTAYAHRCHGEDWQLWREVGSGNSKRYQNKYSGLYLTNSAGCNNNGNTWWLKVYDSYPVNCKEWAQHVTCGSSCNSGGGGGGSSFLRVSNKRILLIC